MTTDEPLALSSFVNELETARTDLRNLDDSIKNLTGRTPAELQNYRGRGRGRGGWQSGGAGRLFQQARSEIQEEDSRIVGIKRKFTAVSQEEGEEGSDYSKRTRRLAIGDRSRIPGDYADPDQFDKPSLQSSVTAAPKEIKSRTEAIKEIEQTEKTELKQRNRRMFQNALLGTLKRFRNDEQRFKQQEERQKHLEAKIEKSKQDEIERLEKEKFDLMNKRREKETEVRKIARKLTMVEMVSDWENHMRKLQNFIQTKTKPPIFYLPAKHTMRTIELQKKSVKRLEDLVTHRKQRLQKELESIDSFASRGPGWGAQDSTEQQDRPKATNSSPPPAKRVKSEAASAWDKSDDDSDSEPEAGEVEPAITNNSEETAASTRVVVVKREHSGEAKDAPNGQDVDNQPASNKDKDTEQEANPNDVTLGDQASTEDQTTAVKDTAASVEGDGPTENGIEGCPPGGKSPAAGENEGADGESGVVPAPVVDILTEAHEELNYDDEL